jgi:hypothetical protein
MEWQNNTTLFDGNDGGIYKTVNGGVNWTHHTNGMQISQMYRLGVSQTTNAVITGLQDNGTKFRNNSNTWSDVLGGDGMECAIDYSNAQYMYGELYFGDIYRSSNQVEAGRASIRWAREVPVTGLHHILYPPAVPQHSMQAIMMSISPPTGEHHGRRFQRICLHRMT